MKRKRGKIKTLTLPARPTLTCEHNSKSDSLNSTTGGTTSTNCGSLLSVTLLLVVGIISSDSDSAELLAALHGTKPPVLLDKLVYLRRRPWGGGHCKVLFEEKEEVAAEVKEEEEGWWWWGGKEALTTTNCRQIMDGYACSLSLKLDLPFSLGLELPRMDWRKQLRSKHDDDVQQFDRCPCAIWFDLSWFVFFS